MTIVERYSALICDLDGVVYRGPMAISSAVAALEDVRAPVVFATNNASRSPAEVAAHLTSLGVRAAAGDVVTSSQAAAQSIVQRASAGARVLCVGGPGVVEAIREAGLTALLPVSGEVDIAAVIQGYGPRVMASDLAAAAYAIQAGALWVATNVDATLPTDHGVAPGNGALIQAVSLAVGRQPDIVAGKPHPPLYELSARRLGVGLDRALAVGDRLETDIEGAVAVGCDSVLVLTGVHGVADVLLAPPDRRPTYVLPDLSWLSEEVEVPRVKGDVGVCGPARAWRDMTGWRVEGVGVAAAQALISRVHHAKDCGETVTPEEIAQASARALALMSR